MDMSGYSPKIRELREQYEAYVGQSDPRVIRVLHKLRREAVALNDDLLLGQTYHCYAFAEYFVCGHYDAFLKYLRKAALCLLRCDDQTEMAHIYYLIALDAMNKRMYDIAGSDFLLARNLFLQAGDENSAAVLDLSIGHVFLLLTDYREARAYMRRALSVIRKNPQHPHFYSNMAGLYMNDGICCLGLDLLSQAEKAFDRTTDFLVRNEGHFRLGTRFDHALLGARLYLKKNDSKKLKEHFSKLMELSPDLPQLANYIEELRKFSSALIESGKIDLAGELLRAFDDGRIPPDAAHSQFLLNEMRVEYYVAVRDAKRLRDAYKKQHEIQLLLIEEQQRTYLHTRDLIYLISELREEQKAVQEERASLLLLAHTDALTGLPNREAMDEHLSLVYEKTYREKTSLGVSVVDLDGLKTYNDSHGHTEGDRILIEFGELLRNVSEDPRIYAARYGGDEFVVVYEGMTDPEIRSVAKNIAKMSPIPISQGICNRVPSQSTRIWDLLNEADRNMYAAKRVSHDNPNSVAIRFRAAKSTDRKGREQIRERESKKEKAAARKELLRYIAQTNEIRSLSSPQISDAMGADHYRSGLLLNFARIKDLAADNIRILQKYLFPAMNSRKRLGREGMAEMRIFSDALIDAYNLKNLDAPLVYSLAKRLLQEADMIDDDEARILSLDGMITAVYLMICMSARLVHVSDLCFKYFRLGQEAGERLLAYLQHDRFSSLSAEMKELVVINARYIRVISEIDDVPGTAAQRKTLLKRMNAALALADDPFYRKQLPDYNWDLHKFRTYEYICCLTDLNNGKGYSKKDLQYIYECTKEMKELYESDVCDFRSIHQIQTLPLYLARNAYLAGEISLADYKAALVPMLLRDYRENPGDNVPMIMLQAPVEYMLVLDPDHLTMEEEGYLSFFYNRLIGYFHETPKKDMLSFLLTWLYLILKYFIEVPNGISFETMGLSLTAALLPTTYIHALGVADFSKALTRHLLQKKPQLFTGMPGYRTLKDVRNHQAEIEDFAYHAALCHDFGKLMIVETILTYGRDLLNDEFEFIRCHPSIGAYLLSRHASTAAYAAVAEGHHKWYNDRSGYPTGFSRKANPYQTVISIVACADCLDAATDSVGRSYKEGKTLDQFLSELKEGSGTRYAPYLAELFAEPEFRAEIETLLAKGRDENYKKTYFLLKKNAGKNDDLMI